jgi:hypothetical protein
VADGAIDWTAPEMQYLAPKDYDLPPADPALLASANRILSDRLEGVAHVLRGCGLPALADISGAEDLQMAAAALSGSYQMALADAAAVPDLRNITAELEATVALQRETLVTAAADVSRLSAELATERRVSGSAISAVASICEHLGCDDHNGHVPVLRAIDDLRAQIASLTADVMRTRGSLNSAINEADRLRAELAVERQACKTLQEQLKRSAAHFINGEPTRAEMPTGLLKATRPDDPWPYDATVKLIWVGSGPGLSKTIGWAKRDENGNLVSTYSLSPLDAECWEVIEERTQATKAGDSILGEQK